MSNPQASHSSPAVGNATKPITATGNVEPFQEPIEPVSDASVPYVGRRYRLLNRLGAGGMGVVFRARDRLTGQHVALKQVTIALNEPIPTDAPTVDPFDRVLALALEFRTLASLRHPNVISVLDYGFDDSRRPFYTMDLLANAETIV